MQPGDSYTKSGKTFTIQFVERGQVFGVMYREGFGCPDDWDGTEAEFPDGYLGNYRMTIAEFEKAIVGAVVAEAVS